MKLSEAVLKLQNSGGRYLDWPFSWSLSEAFGVGC